MDGEIAPPPVTRTEVTIDLPPDEAFDLVADASQYPRWLVGAQKVVRVDPHWPAVGSRFEHRIGVGRLVIPGSTTVRAAHPPRSLELGAGLGLLGEAWVRFELEARGPGTRVVMVEQPEHGITSALARLVRRAARTVLRARNESSLHGLAAVAAERAETRAARATIDAGGEPVDTDGAAPEVEGPNSA